MNRNNNERMHDDNGYDEGGYYEDHHHDQISYEDIAIKLPFPPKIDPHDLISKKSSVRIPSRTPNAFIIYRKIFVETARNMNYNLSMTTISRLACKSWRNESNEVKAAYKKLAKSALDIRNDVFPKWNRRKRKDRWNIVRLDSPSTNNSHEAEKRKAKERKPKDKKASHPVKKTTRPSPSANFAADIAASSNHTTSVTTTTRPYENCPTVLNTDPFLGEIENYINTAGAVFTLRDKDYNMNFSIPTPPYTPNNCFDSSFGHMMDDDSIPQTLMDTSCAQTQDHNSTPLGTPNMSNTNLTSLTGDYNLALNNDGMISIPPLDPYYGYFRYDNYTSIFDEMYNFQEDPWLYGQTFPRFI